MRNFDYKKSLGQNFLIDNNIISIISKAINPNSDDLIVEIGPGAGALTKELIKKNCNVICFEIDQRLKEVLNNINANNLEIIYEDFLKANISEHIDYQKYKNIYFVGNLPYYITTPIIGKIIKESKPYEIIIMVQKEVGERFMAKPNTKKYGSLSVFLQYYFDITKIVDVNRNCFEPKPKVDSVVLKFEKHNKYNAKNEEKFHKLVIDSFVQKRKNIKNNLKDYDLSIIEKVLLKNNKNLSSRAESLKIEEFIEMSNELFRE